MSINKRILELVELKAGGNKAKFAGMIDYVPQYMSRITKEGDLAGMTVVEKILKAFPDVNPKWLVIGEGMMLVPDPELAEMIDKKIVELRTLQSSIGNMSGARMDALKRKIRDFDLRPADSTRNST